MSVPNEAHYTDKISYFITFFISIEASIRLTLKVAQGPLNPRLVRGCRTIYGLRIPRPGVCQGRISRSSA